jgi:hypothetical protein
MNARDVTFWGLPTLIVGGEHETGDELGCRLPGGRR